MRLEQTQQRRAHLTPAAPPCPTAPPPAHPPRPLPAPLPLLQRPQGLAWGPGAAPGRRPLQQRGPALAHACPPGPPGRATAAAATAAARPRRPTAGAGWPSGAPSTPAPQQHGLEPPKVVAQHSVTRSRRGRKGGRQGSSTLCTQRPRACARTAAPYLGPCGKAVHGGGWGAFEGGNGLGQARQHLRRACTHARMRQARQRVASGSACTTPQRPRLFGNIPLGATQRARLPHKPCPPTPRPQAPPARCTAALHARAPRA